MNSILSLFTGSTLSTGVFAGKVVTFTDTLQSGSRKMLCSEAERIVTERGGRVVTGEYGRLRNTNLLVLGKQAGDPPEWVFWD